MKKPTDILVMGDVHAEFGELNRLINKKKPSIILQCGDFGFWPNMMISDAKGRVQGLKPVMAKKSKIYWCDGNHEDHASLLQIASNEVFPNVFFMKRTSTLTLPDGRTVMFMGGATSVDKEWRTPGFDWFPEETATFKNIENLPDIKVDILISHTCPTEFPIAAEEARLTDPSRDVLSAVLRRYKPTLWYFGHFHCLQTGDYNGCKWTGLSMAGAHDWWQWLPARK